MCGIAGHIGNRELSAAAISRCQELLRQRGPDAAGYFHHEIGNGRHFHLVHTRLSIIDLDARSNQPFQSGDHVLALNGELYNYVEVKALLRQEGVTFRTESDTEVLLELLRRQGACGLDRCEGMWAFALFDKSNGSLLLARDRFGEKPLYIYQDAAGLYFASEVKALAALVGKKLSPNRQHLYRYLVNGYKALYKTSHTFFEGVTELPPANVLTIDGQGAVQQHAYWQPRYCPDESMTYDDAVAGARERLLRAVELRLRADVPLAFCMSGGVDSNALISTAKRVFDYDVHGFTIVNTDERYEEQRMVDCAVKELGIRHTPIPVQTGDFLDGLRRLVRYHDAPVYTITYYAHWLLMQSVAEHGYRISISGTAADEIFSGYFDHHLFYLQGVSGDPELYARSRAAWAEHIQPVVRNPFLSDADRFVRDPSFRDHVYLKADEFAEYLFEPWQEPFVETAYTDDLLRNRMMNELFHEATPVILHEDDLNAMYFSIENRSPFLDRQLFDFCYRIPSRHLIQDGAAKAVLRDAMKGIVPEPVRTNRRKVGFNAPIFSFLDVHDPDVRAYLLDDGPVFEHVRKDHIESLLGRDDLPNSESKFLFNFLNTKVFLEEVAT